MQRANAKSSVGVLVRILAIVRMCVTVSMEMNMTIPIMFMFVGVDVLLKRAPQCP